MFLSPKTICAHTIEVQNRLLSYFLFTHKSLFFLYYTRSENNQLVKDQSTITGGVAMGSNHFWLKHTRILLKNRLRMPN